MSSERRLFPLRLRGRLVHPPPLSPRPESPHNAAAVLRLHSSGARTTVGTSRGIVRGWHAGHGANKQSCSNDSNDEYAPRLSSRTGGFEGLTTEVDSGVYSSSVDNDDACTLQMGNNTIQTVPAWPTTTTTTTTKLRLDPNFPHSVTDPLPCRRRRFLAPRMFHSNGSSKAAAASTSAASSNGGLYSAETAVAMNTTYKPSNDLANNNNNNINSKSVGTRSVLFGRKRSSISNNNSNSDDKTPPSSNTQQGMVPPRSPVPPRPTSTLTNFSAAAAVLPRQSSSSGKNAPGGARFRLPDEPQRAQQQQQKRLPHPDSPVTFDHTDAAVVLGSAPSVSDGVAPVVPTATTSTVGPPPPPLVRLPSLPRSTTDQGFELSISGHVVQDTNRALLVRPVALPTPIPILRQRNKNATTTVPVDVDTATPVQVEVSPGTVRLTEDKLKRHEQRQSLPHGCPDHASEKESRLLMRAHSDRPDRGAKNSNNNNNSKIPLVKHASSFLRRRPPPEDVANFSLAPLHIMEENVVVTAAAAAAARDPVVVLRRVRSRTGGGGKHEKDGCRTSVVEGILRKLPFSRRTSSYNDNAAVILERERMAAWESQRAYWEAQERKRIERKRRDYDLERQRSPELCAMTSAQRAAVFAGMELVEQDRIVTQQQQKQEQQLPQYQPPTDQHTQSTSCSTLTLGPAALGVPIFPPCVVCRQDHRTHIATPCMHLAYCANCARALRRQKRGCAVCGIQDVKFAAVSF